MPHTLTQDVNAENILDYSKALAEDCIISGIYKSATLYAKRVDQDSYHYSLIAHEPKKEENQIIESSTRIISLIDFNRLLSIVEEVYKIFTSRAENKDIEINTNDQTINISINMLGEWKIAIANMSNEEQEKITELLNKLK